DGIAGPFWDISDEMTVTGCTFNNSNNCAINVQNEFTNAYIANNSIKNTGLLFGMIPTGGGTGIGIVAIGPASTIENNRVDSSAYNGIMFFGSNTIVNENYITE